jgi:hypothetical protein
LPVTVPHVRVAALAAALALLSCAGPRWTKPGVDAATAQADFLECQALGDQATRRDSDIEADILASRGRDWENSGTLGAHQDLFAYEGARRSGDVVAACMRAKGYAPPQ